MMTVRDNRRVWRLYWRRTGAGAYTASFPAAWTADDVRALAGLDHAEEGDELIDVEPVT